MYKYYFEKLEVWQLARTLSKEIYEVTKIFPKSEMFGLTNQIRRAIISVASNIAEGSGRTSNKDKAHFIQLSYGSLMEVLNQLIIANDLNILSDNNYLELRKYIEELSNKLNSLRNSYLTKFTN
ncbi:MAG: four helix bundle protein [bacterium]|nr:four helix bundle protein [bacterium]